MDLSDSYKKIIQSINSDKEIEEIKSDLEENIKIMSIDDVYKIFRDIEYPVSHEIIAEIYTLIREKIISVDKTQLLNPIFIESMGIFLGKILGSPKYRLEENSIEIYLRICIGFVFVTAIGMYKKYDHNKIVKEMQKYDRRKMYKFIHVMNKYATKKLKGYELSIPIYVIAMIVGLFNTNNQKFDVNWDDGMYILFTGKSLEYTTETLRDLDILEKQNIFMKKWIKILPFVQYIKCPNKYYDDFFKSIEIICSSRYVDVDKPKIINIQNILKELVEFNEIVFNNQLIDGDDFVDATLQIFNNFMVSLVRPIEIIKNFEDWINLYNPTVDIIKKDLDRTRFINIYPIMFKDNKTKLILPSWFGSYPQLIHGNNPLTEYKVLEKGNSDPDSRPIIFGKFALKLYDPYITPITENITINALNKNFSGTNSKLFEYDKYRGYKRITYNESMGEDYGGITKEIIHDLISNFTKGGTVLLNPKESKMYEQHDLDKPEVKPLFIKKNDLIIPSNIDVSELKQSCKILTGIDDDHEYESFDVCTYIYDSIYVKKVYRSLGRLIAQISFVYNTKVNLKFVKLLVMKLNIIKHIGSSFSDHTLIQQANLYLYALFYDNLELCKLLTMILHVKNHDDLYKRITDIIFLFKDSMVYIKPKNVQDHPIRRIYQTLDRNIIPLRQILGKLPKKFTKDKLPPTSIDDWDVLHNINIDERLNVLKYLYSAIMEESCNNYSDCFKVLSNSPFNPYENSVIDYSENIDTLKYKIIIETAKWYYGIKRLNKHTGKMMELDLYRELVNGLYDIKPEPEPFPKKSSKYYFEDWNYDSLHKQDTYAAIVRNNSFFFDYEVDKPIDILNKIVVVINISPTLLKRYDIERYEKILSEYKIPLENIDEYKNISTDNNENATRVKNQIVKLMEWIHEFITSDKLYNIQGPDNDIILENVKNKNEKLKRLFIFWSAKDKPTERQYKIDIFFSKKSFDKQYDLKNHQLVRSSTCFNRLYFNDTVDWFYENTQQQDLVKNLDENKKLFFNNLIKSINYGQAGFGLAGGGRNTNKNEYYLNKYRKYKTKYMQLKKSYIL